MSSVPADVPAEVPADSPVRAPGGLPAGRYGRARGRRPVLVAGAVLLVIAVGWSAWYALTLGNPAVTWQDIGFRTGADGVDVTFDVTFRSSLDGAARAVCSVEAQNAVHTVVGTREVTVGPAAARTLRVRTRVPTSEPPVTGLVTSCAMAR